MFTEFSSQRSIQIPQLKEIFGEIYFHSKSLTILQSFGLKIIFSLLYIYVP